MSRGNQREHLREILSNWPTSLPGSVAKGIVLCVDG